MLIRDIFKFDNKKLNETKQYEYLYERKRCSNEHIFIQICQNIEINQKIYILNKTNENKYKKN